MQIKLAQIHPTKGHVQGHIIQHDVGVVRIGPPQRHRNARAGVLPNRDPRSIAQEIADAFRCREIIGVMGLPGAHVIAIAGLFGFNLDGGGGRRLHIGEGIRAAENCCQHSHAGEPCVHSVSFIRRVVCSPSL